jgi:DHA3 family macrolide efflux protein-like MFS transporter
LRVATQSYTATPPKESLAGNRNFLLLWTGQFVSQLGDRLAMVAFPWLVYQKTGSAFSTGVVLALYTLPYVLFGPFAGVVIDRFDKRRLMVVADLLRAGLVLGIALMAHPALPLVFAVSFLMASVTVFFDPCKLSLLPDIVRPTQLVRANSFLTMGENLSEIIGYSVAGLVAYYLSARIAFVADSATFLVSGVALFLMVYTPPVRDAALRQSRRILGQIREGTAFLFWHRQLAANTLLVIAAALGLGAAYPLTFLLAVDVLGQGTKAFGLMEAAVALGYFAGSAVLAGVGARLRKGYAMTLGLSTMGASLVAVGLLHGLTAILVAFLLLGLANAAALIAIDTFFQEAVPEHLRGRVWGVRFALTQGAYALSVLAGGALAGAFDVQKLFIAAGLMVAIPGLIGLATRPVREI